MNHPRWGKRTYIFPYRVYTKTFTCKSPYIKATYGKTVQFGTKQLRLRQLTINISTKIAPHVSSVFRDPGVIFDQYILCRSTIFSIADHAGTADPCYDAQNEQENTQDDVIEGDIRREVAVD